MSNILKPSSLRPGNIVSGTESSLKYPMPLIVLAVTLNKAYVRFDNEKVELSLTLDKDINMTCDTPLYGLELTDGILIELLGFTKIDPFHLVSPVFNDQRFVLYKAWQTEGVYFRKPYNWPQKEIKHFHEVQNIAFGLFCEDFLVDVTQINDYLQKQIQ